MGHFKKHINNSPTEVSPPPCLPFNYRIAQCFYYFYQVFILHIFNNMQGYGKFQAQDLQNSLVRPHGGGGGGEKIGTKGKTKDFRKDSMIRNININSPPSSFSTVVVFLKENFLYCGGGQANYACLTCTPGSNSKIKKVFPKAVVFTTKLCFDVKRMYIVSLITSMQGLVVRTIVLEKTYIY